MISKRLKMLREAKGLTKKKVAEELDMPYTTYLHYEDGSNEPNISVLVKLSLYYQISVDWLIGLESNDEKNLPPEDKWEVLEKQLEALSEEEIIELEEYVQFLLWKRLQRKSRREQG